MLSKTISSGIVAGTVYKFKYRASNVLGWGEFSDEVTIKAAKEPEQMNTVSTLIENTFVKIYWDYPNDNYDSI